MDQQDHSEEGPPKDQEWSGLPPKGESLDSDGPECQGDGCLKMRVLTMYIKSELWRLNLTAAYPMTHSD